ncbi:hypothetical protein [Adhaeretor mobilis]|uniref:Carboxypeptidase regulatory-like domain-containing protein n=1 Tax=Adhaeretor mobilis TaxID=1930276 RepID=A0A517MTL3_9BACT|nr:hypothetical protein [Adhaeretor mobilis]QDS98226.1 hypothetical protein HG15A2_14990 [Adhaeretor mobilis]
MAVCPLIGCGGDGAEGRFAISGKVTFDGQPVTNGNIGFVSTKPGTVEPAGTDVVDGQYSVPQYEGPTEGTYKVVIYADRPSGRKIEADEGSTEMMDQMEQYIPEVYNARSTLTVEISGDRDDLDFDLKKQKQTRRRRR